MNTNEIAEADRFPVGCRVRVANGGETFDATPGLECVIEAYVAADERDAPTDPPYYMIEDPEGCLFGGAVPHDVLTMVKTPEEQAAADRGPTPEEITEYVSSSLHSGWSGEVRISESSILSKVSNGEWPEGENGYTHGVEFYGRREDGKRFGCIVRVTALWECDD